MPIFLSEESENIRKQAEQLSLRLGHFYVGCEHFFLSVLDSTGWLSQELEDHGIDIDQIRECILNICGPGDDTPLWKGTITTPRAKKMLKLAEREAEEARSYRVEPNHIIAAILREGRSVPARVLENEKVDLATMRQNILKSSNRNQMPAQKSFQQPSGSFPAAGTPYSAFIAQKGKALTPANPMGKAGEKGKAPPAEKKVKTPTIDRLGRDLVQMAKDGKIDPIMGRKDEIRRVLQTLTKKAKNNPIIIGEAGVGKTAVVYGLAQRIAEGKVPEVVRDKQLIEINMASVVAGTKHRGEFEERMQKIITELTGNPDIIVFIDEIHTIIGAGDSKGGMDAGNILKPYLARGEITIIGATTIDEYRKHIEKDPALERRFQSVMVDEPSEEETVEILNGLKERYEKHHNVSFSPKAIIDAVKLSVRYIPDRNLPDKAIDLMDEAAARSKMTTISITCEEDLKEMKKEKTEVTHEDIAEVISLWTGIPASKLTQQESEKLLHMEDYLRERVVGQETAVRTVAQTIRMVRMGLSSPTRPSGVFLFLGPTGVGKTELAKSLAEFLFGSEKDMIRLDMSEYKEKHAISRMIGSPPGYVGHEEEGQLTSAVRTKPYSVVLLDEVEKAHPEVFDLFLQVFDDGRLTDSKGRTVNFTNTILIMTSNIGTSVIDFDDPSVDVSTDRALREQMMEALKGHFRPEFLNRIDEIVIFKPLTEQVLLEIVRKNLETLADQLLKQREITLRAHESALHYLLRQGYDPAFGARPMKRAIQNYMAKPMAEKMLASGVQSGDCILITSDGEGLVFEKVDPPLPGLGETIAPGEGTANPGPSNGNGRGPGRGGRPADDGTIAPGDMNPSGNRRLDRSTKDAPPSDFKQSKSNDGPQKIDPRLAPLGTDPITRKRDKMRDLGGILPMKGPLMRPSGPPKDIDPEDFEDTRPGSSPK